MLSLAEIISYKISFHTGHKEEKTLTKVNHLHYNGMNKL
jgi:hypothetical protein